MKNFSKILFAGLMVCLMSFAANAQRFDPVAAHGDNTGKSLTYTTATNVISASVDTVKLRTNAFHSFVTFDTTSTQSVNVALKVKMYTTLARRWDHITIVVNSDTAKVLTFISGTGYRVAVNGTLTVQRTQKATIEFVYDGICWNEKYRTIATKP